MSKLKDLKTLFVEELRDLYNAENQLVKALPKVAKASASPELKQAILDHLEETKVHVTRLDRIFDELDTRATGKKCKAMEGLVAEGKEMIEEEGVPVIKDAGLIGAAQRVEHYEMAGYGTVRNLAKLLGLDDIAETLQETLDEEGAADKKLTAIAEGLELEPQEAEPAGLGARRRRR